MIRRAALLGTATVITGTAGLRRDLPRRDYRGGTGESAHREAIAEARPYLVRDDVYDEAGKRTDQAHVHYYSRETSADERLSFDIDATGALTRR